MKQVQERSIKEQLKEFIKTTFLSKKGYHGYRMAHMKTYCSACLFIMPYKPIAFQILKHIQPPLEKEKRGQG